MTSLNNLIIAMFCVLCGVSFGESVVRRLNLHKNFTLSYEIKNNLTIEFVIEAKTKGWVAIGLNTQNASMLNRDYFMGYVNGTDKIIGDYYLALNAPERTPQLDPPSLQHWILLNATETDGTQNGTTTKMAFTRDLVTGDVYDQPITNKTIQLLWSYNGDTDDRTVIHTMRGAIQVNLITGVVGGGRSPVRRLNLHSNFTLFYEVKNNRTIEFVIEAKTKGWVAIGFNHQNPSMFNTDYFMGFVNGSNVSAGDYYLEPNANAIQRRPQLDPPSLQHWLLLNATETNNPQNGTTTKMAIARNLITNDAFDKPIANNTLQLLWSYNGNTDDLTAMHTASGAVKVNLITGVVGDSGGESPVRRLNLHQNFTLFYEVKNNRTIEFVIEAKTKGWVAIGFNPQNVSLFNTDYFMGYVNGSNVSAGDYYLEPNATQRRPQLDPPNLQHWILLNATETSIAQNGTTTKMAITRNLITNDEYDKAITNNTLELLWSYNGNTDDLTVPHTVRGSVQINLITGVVSGNNRRGKFQTTQRAIMASTRAPLLNQDPL